MDGEHTLNTLHRKRSEIAGEIEALNDATKQKIIDLAHIDATIRLLDPEVKFPELPPRVVRPDPKVFRGEVQSILLKEIRDRGCASTRELTDVIMLARGLDPLDVRARSIVGKRVKDRIGTMRRQGRVISESSGVGASRVWRLAAESKPRPKNV